MSVPEPTADSSEAELAELARLKLRAVARAEATAGFYWQVISALVSAAPDSRALLAAIDERVTAWIARIEASETASEKGVELERDLVKEANTTADMFFRQFRREMLGHAAD